MLFEYDTIGSQKEIDFMYCDQKKLLSVFEEHPLLVMLNSIFSLFLSRLTLTVFEDYESILEL